MDVYATAAPAGGCVCTVISCGIDLVVALGILLVNSWFWLSEATAAMRLDPNGTGVGTDSDLSSGSASVPLMATGVNWW